MSLRVFRRKLEDFLRIESLVCRYVDDDIKPYSSCDETVVNTSKPNYSSALRLQLPQNNSHVTTFTTINQVLKKWPSRPTWQLNRTPSATGSTSYSSRFTSILTTTLLSRPSKNRLIRASLRGTS
ncbi:hypothetical protein MPH_09261 [Macrophomina phaseolina MS6]|uniref:Uncharacterized protein n=1 Tax=Macrophomina phaseolina (strain MS6) TaxID=1126212 RepID=K2RLC3_MACPH|nr:hypothetical protein MPH_09261 [Macrophomina phaseolina MS6]